MKKSRTMDNLISRRDRLRNAIRLLNAELSEIETEISTNRVSLDKDFFWKEVFPILDSQDSGLTGQNIREKLKKSGVTVDPDRFRIFLTRNKSSGFLSLNESIGGAGYWKLTQEAKEKYKSIMQESLK